MGQGVGAQWRIVSGQESLPGVSQTHHRNHHLFRGYARAGWPARMLKFSMIKEENGFSSAEMPVELNRGKLGLWGRLNPNPKASPAPRAAGTLQELCKKPRCGIGHL